GWRGMRLVKNSATDRGVDRLREWLDQGAFLDIVSPTFSLAAFAELRGVLDGVERCRLLLGDASSVFPGLVGSDADIVFRRQLQGRWLARLVADWAQKRVEIRHTRR